MSDSCRICGRSLTNPSSKEVGMGEVCAGRLAASLWREQDPRKFELTPRSDWPESELKLPPTPKGRTYHFRRNLAGDPEIFAEREGGCQHYVRHICHHSPTGMEYGYGGSGPADCARSVLADCVGLALADRLYQEFKFAVISEIDQRKGGAINETAIRDWVAKRLEPKGDPK